MNYVIDTHALLLPRLTAIPEMHDRIIAAAAIALDAPVVTKDRAIHASQDVRTVW